MKPLSAYRVFAILCLVALVLWWHVILATLDLALHTDAYTHLLLILPISIAMICSEWRVRNVQVRPNLPAGLTLLTLSLLVSFAGERWRARGDIPADIQMSLGMLAVVAWWVGSFVACFGTRVSRTFVFPLCFLLLLVPLPEVALNYIISGLQLGSASAAHLLFAAVHLPVVQDRTRVSIPGLTIEVAAQCSSIRSSLMLLVTSMVLAQLLLHSVWSKAIIMLTTPILCIAKNGFRVFTLAMLGVDVDPGYLHGRLHHQGGVVFFLLFLGVLLALLGLARWVEHKTTIRPMINNLQPSCSIRAG